MRVRSRGRNSRSSRNRRGIVTTLFGRKSKKGKRIVGDIKINPLGKAKQEQNAVLTTSVKLTGGWIKITPVNALEPGEYAVVEMLGKDGMNTYVWDFGVNPAAPANASALIPEQVAQPEKPK